MVVKVLFWTLVVGLIAKAVCVCRQHPRKMEFSVVEDFIGFIINAVFVIWLGLYLWW